MLFLCLGIWATLSAYGLVPESICCGLKWNARFAKHLKWLGPLLVVMTLGDLFLCVFVW